MGTKLLLWPELAERGVRKSRRQIDRDEAAGLFPKRVPLGENRVAWVTDEIDEHVAKQIASRSMRPGTIGTFDATRSQQTKVASEITETAE